MGREASCAVAATRRSHKDGPWLLDTNNTYPWPGSAFHGPCNLVVKLERHAGSRAALGPRLHGGARWSPSGQLPATDGRVTMAEDEAGPRPSRVLLQYVLLL